MVRYTTLLCEYTDTWYDIQHCYVNTLTHGMIYNTATRIHYYMVRYTTLVCEYTNTWYDTQHCYVNTLTHGTIYNTAM